ncbi:MAG: hypothetical protein ACK4S2_00645 [Gemmobacter sp.]|uniref:hypothetical protein n=1 Tax=Gemmobacter sp. TaxID=1898957 RepID=UPI003918D57C
MTRSKLRENRIIAILREGGRFPAASCDPAPRRPCDELQADPKALPHEGPGGAAQAGRKRALGTRAPPVTEAVAKARWSADVMLDPFADGSGRTFNGRMRVGQLRESFRPQSEAICCIQASAETWGKTGTMPKT